jgi:hypothetical protein
MRDRTLVVTASALTNATVCLQWMLLLAGSVLFILGIKSWRGRFGDRHRCVDERRHAVCHGIADRPFDRCAIPRTIPRAIRRQSVVNRRERHALQTQSARTRIRSIVRNSILRGSAARLIYACSACPLVHLWEGCPGPRPVSVEWPRVLPLRGPDSSRLSGRPATDRRDHGRTGTTRVFRCAHRGGG